MDTTAPKHTPGPWRIDETKFGRRTIKNAKGASVVVIEKWTAEEDARLIAAAPDMLTVLSATYLALLRHPHDAWRIENQGTLSDLRNVIATATGRDEQDVQDDFEFRANAEGR